MFLLEPLICLLSVAAAFVFAQLDFSCHWPFRQVVLFSPGCLLCVAAGLLCSWIFVRACHWPTCRADDSRGVGVFSRASN